ALVATAGEYKLEMRIVSAAREVNHKQRERVVEKLLDELKILKGRTVGLLGLAFKPDTDDLREAPALDVARELLLRGVQVRAHDPVAMDRFTKEFPDLGITLCPSPAGVAKEADAIILITEWPEYRTLNWEEMGADMRSRVVLDGRQVLDRQRL